MKLAITQPNGPLTLTSREIADLLEMRHDNVKRTIDALASRGAITLPQIEEVSNDGPGPKKIYIYRVGKRDSFVIVAQLSPEFTARLVDRWQVLEDRVNHPPLNLREPKQLVAAALQLIEVNQELQAKVSELAPKAVALDLLSTPTVGSTCIREAAKKLEQSPKDFFANLRAWGWIFPLRAGGWSAYSSRLASGHLEIKITTIERTDGRSKLVSQVLVTPKGLARLALKLGKGIPDAA